MNTIFSKKNYFLLLLLSMISCSCLSRPMALPLPCLSQNHYQMKDSITDNSIEVLFKQKLSSEKQVCMQMLSSSSEELTCDKMLSVEGASEYADKDNLLHARFVKALGDFLLSHEGVRTEILKQVANEHDLGTVIENAAFRFKHHDQSKFLPEGSIEPGHCHSDGICNDMNIEDFLISGTPEMVIIEGYRCVSNVFAAPYSYSKKRNFIFDKDHNDECKNKACKAVELHLRSESHHPMFWNTARAHSNDGQGHDMKTILQDSTNIVPVFLEMIVDGWSRSIIQSIRSRRFPDYCQSTNENQCLYCRSTDYDIDSFIKVDKNSKGFFSHSIKEAFDKERKSDVEPGQEFEQALFLLSGAIAEKLDDSGFEKVVSELLSK